MKKEHNKFTLAHFNPKELNILDEMQGGRTNIDDTDDLRHYGQLEKMMSQPHIEKIIMKEYEHHAKGGHVGEILREADNMRHKGRHGDSEMALIGPNTHRVMNHLMNGGSINPMTRKPEYFNFGSFLGGIGKHLMGALPGAAAGFMSGGPLGALMGGGSSLMSGMMGGEGGQPQQGQQNVRQAPTNIRDLGRQFMSSPTGQNMMNSQYGQMAQNAYRQGSEMMNSPYGRMAKKMYNQGSEMMNSPDGEEIMNSPMGQQARGMYNQGRGMYNQARDMYNQADQGYGNVMNQGNQYNNQANDFMNQPEDNQQQPYQPQRRQNQMRQPQMRQNQRRQSQVRRRQSNLSEGSRYTNQYNNQYGE